MEYIKKTLIAFGAIAMLYPSEATSSNIFSYFHKSKNSKVKIIYIDSGDKYYYYKHFEQKGKCENELTFVVNKKYEETSIYGRDSNCDNKADFIKIRKKKKEYGKKIFSKTLTATRINYNGFKKEFNTMDSFFRKISSGKLEELIDKQN